MNGILTSGTSIYEALGVEPDTVRWYHLALCEGSELNMFFDTYETNVSVARQIDQMCLSCPVRKLCLSEGVDDKDHGVRGGIYLVAGKPSIKYNKHKTPEVWEALK